MSNQSQWHKLYTSKRWRNARSFFLAANRHCVYCKQIGMTIPADTVDHIRPHKGDLNMFWDSRNWQALCRQCHNIHKQREEQGLPVRQPVDVNGNPPGWQ